MAFSPPQFPLTCNLWRAWAGGINPPSGPPTVQNIPCQLRMYKTAYGVARAANQIGIMALLLGKQADVRETTGGALGDAVEVPAGSGRFYTVLGVDDVAKGFANEYRLAWIGSNKQRAGWWPQPTP